MGVFGKKWILVLNLLIFGFIGLSFGREALRDWEIDRDIAQLQKEAAALEAENLSLRELALAFQTESYLEREARLKLGLKKQGEELVVVQTPDHLWQEEQTRGIETELTVIDEAANPSEHLLNPTKWWLFFFDPTRFEQLSS